MSRARAVAALTIVCAATALGACGGDDEQRAPVLTGPLNSTSDEMTIPASTLPDPAALDVPVPAGMHGARRQAFVAGRDVARASGCLACHRIGPDGGTLGPDLNGIGTRLSSRMIRRSLVNPTAPMPSYKELSAAKLDALVTFLTALARTPG